MAEQAGKQVAASGGMQNILSLLQTIAGTDTKTTSTANIAPLQSVMDQIAASQGTQGQQLLEAIFQQAAGAVPGIMGNTFNATGTRAPNGQMAGTLQKLMADVTRQAQAQIVQQQQQAQQMQLQAASQIAASTRGSKTTQKSGASDLIAKGGKILAANKLVKDLTGKDLIQKGVNAVQGMFQPSIPSYTLGTAAPLFGGTSTAGFGMDAAAPTLAGLGFTSPMSDAVGGLPLFSGGTELPASMSSMPTSESIAATLDPLSGIEFGGGNPAAAPSLSSSLSLSLPQGYGDGGLSVSDSGLNSANSLGGEDLGNFSSASGDGGSAASDAATLLKVYGYAKDPDKRKDIFDFSDGNFVDDVGDITDAVSVYFPPAGMVRPAMNATVAAGESLDNFVHNPGQWFEDLLSGDEPITENAWNTAVGTVKGTADAIGDLGQDIIDFGSNAFEEAGDFFGDVFGW